MVLLYWNRMVYTVLFFYFVTVTDADVSDWIKFESFVYKRCTLAFLPSIC